MEESAVERPHPRNGRGSSPLHFEGCRAAQSQAGRASPRDSSSPGQASGEAVARGGSRASRPSPRCDGAQGVLWQGHGQRGDESPQSRVQLRARPERSSSPNPVRLRRQWNKVTARDRHLGHDHLPAFHEAVLELESPIARDYLLLVLFTGLRRREAASLRWSDVDLTAKKLTIPAERTKPGRKLDLPLTDYVHDLLVARRAIGRTEFIFHADSKSGHIESRNFTLRWWPRSPGSGLGSRSQADLHHDCRELRHQPDSAEGSGQPRARQRRHVRLRPDQRRAPERACPESSRQDQGALSDPPARCVAR